MAATPEAWISALAAAMVIVTSHRLKKISLCSNIIPIFAFSEFVIIPKT